MKENKTALTDRQALTGTIAYSLLYSLDQRGYGVKARSKLMQSFNRKFIPIRRANPGMMKQFSKQADKALRLSIQDFPDGIQITVSKVIWIWMKKDPESFKPYKTNIKHAAALSRAGDVDDAAFSSSKVVTSLMNCISTILKEQNDEKSTRELTTPIKGS